MKTARYIFLRPGLAIGVFILAFTGLVALLAPWVAPHDPFEQELLFGLGTPSAGHIMGRDLLGRDVFSRIIHGSRISFSVGFIVIGISASFGIFAGSVAGSIGGRAEMLLMRIMDMAQAFPGLLLAISIMAVLGPGFGNLTLALCLTGWVNFARLTRGQILSLREREFVTAAIASGAGRTRLVFFHYLPNAAAPLLVEATFGLASVIVAEAGLGFLGLGIQPPAPSWGSMLNEGRPFLLIAPHLTLFPGLCLLLLVLGVNLVGDALRDMLDVKI